MALRLLGSLLVLGAGLFAARAAEAQPYTPPQPYPTPYSYPPQQPPYGQPPHAQPPYGQPPYAPPPYAQPPYQQPPYGQPPYGSSAPPQRAAQATKHGDHAAGMLALGLWGDYTQVRGSDADDHGPGLQLALWGNMVMTGDYVTIRAEVQGGIGGSFAGLDSVLRTNLMIGARGYFDDNHGPFFRLGVGAQELGNGKLYVSFIELPALQVGYQYVDDNVLFELGPHAGVMLDGRYDVGDEARRKFGTALDAGAFALLQTKGIQLSADWMRVFARQTDDGSPIDMLRGSACLSIVPVALCLDGAQYSGEVGHGTPRGLERARSLYVGALLGVGIVSGTNADAK